MKTEPKKKKIDEYEKRELYYYNLAYNDPNALLSIITEQQISCEELLIAIDSCQLIDNRRKVIPVLIKLLSHPIPTVREYAICVLAKKMTPKIRKAFISTIEKEENETIKSILSDYI